MKGFIFQGLIVEGCRCEKDSEDHTVAVCYFPRFAGGWLCDTVLGSHLKDQGSFFFLQWSTNPLYG